MRILFRFLLTRFLPLDFYDERDVISMTAVTRFFHTCTEKRDSVGVTEFSVTRRWDENSVVGTQKIPVGGFYATNRSRTFTLVHLTLIHLTYNMCALRLPEALALIGPFYFYDFIVRTLNLRFIFLLNRSQSPQLGFNIAHCPGENPRLR